MLRSPPASTLLPYTTLFRSRAMLRRIEPQGVPSRSRVRRASRVSDGVVAGVGSVGSDIGLRIGRGGGGEGRSEEHTSELQSRGHLVCRLLLEKKKKKKKTTD